MEDGDGFVVFLLILAMALLTYMGYDAGFKAGQTRLLSGQAPSYQLVTNSLGEVNWSEK